MRTKKYDSRSTAYKLAKACARNPLKGAVCLFEGVLLLDAETMAQPAALRPVQAKRASRVGFFRVSMLRKLSGRALQSRLATSESPISTPPSGKYSFQRWSTVLAVSGSQNSSSGYPGFIRASSTMGPL